MGAAVPGRGVRGLGKDPRLKWSALFTDQEQRREAFRKLKKRKEHFEKEVASSTPFTV